MKVFNKFLILVILTVIASCNNDDLIDNTNISNEINIELEGRNFKLINDQIISNENCNSLYISCAFQEPNGVFFRVNFELSKGGEILDARLNYYKDNIQNTRQFNAHDFDIKSTFLISNFEYNEIEKTIKFKFDGLLINLFNNADTINIKGNANINSYSTTVCNRNFTHLKYNNFEGATLYSQTLFRTKLGNGSQIHRYFTTNGYRFFIHIDDDFWNLPLGEYNFNQNSSDKYISVIKYSGPNVASTNSEINLENWITYETIGQIIIENKLIENNEKTIEGIINIQLFENNVLTKTYNNIKFKTGSFIN